MKAKMSVGSLRGAVLAVAGLPLVVLAAQGTELARFGLTGYGGFGSASNDGAYILDGMKQRVAAAVKDYLEANTAGAGPETR